MFTKDVAKMVRRKLWQRRTRIRCRRGVPARLPFQATYLVTTELGVFAAGNGGARLLTDKPGYGIAISGDSVAISYETASSSFRPKNVSRVVKAAVQDLLEGRLFGQPDRLPVLYEQPFRSNNGRIHQMEAVGSSDHLGGPGLLIAATDENCIVSVDWSGRVSGKAYPFLDGFGEPIRSVDHNHINTVTAADGGIYFVAYKSDRESSFIGYLSRGHVFGWRVPPRGFHDLELTRTGFLACDTFGSDGSGRVLSEEGVYQEDFFKRRDLVPRGISANCQETVVGHSYKGPRSKRYDGNGGLVVAREGAPPEFASMPWAQTYDVTDVGMQKLRAEREDSLRAALNERFGSPEDLGPYIWESHADGQ